MNDNPFMSDDGSPALLADPTNSAKRTEAPAAAVDPDANPFANEDGSPVFWTPPKAKEAPPVMEDIAKTVPSAAVRGVNMVAGMPGDMSNMADQGIGRILEHGVQEAGLWGAQKLGLLSPERADKFRQDTEKMRQAEYADSVNSNSGLPTSQGLNKAVESVTGPLYQPQTRPGKFVNTAVELAPMVATGPGGIARKVATTIGAGGASEAAGEATEGTSLEGPARMAGAVVGGGLTEGAIGVTRAAAQRAEQYALRSPATQEATATDKLRGRLTDPAATQAAVEDAYGPKATVAAPGATPTAPPELVPGAKPTLFQLTGDKGAGQAEYELQGKRTDLYKENPYGTGSEQQAVAEKKALDQLRPGAPPEDIASFARNQFDAMDTANEAAEQQARTSALAQTQALGGDRSPTASGTDINAAIRPGYDAAVTDAANATTRLGDVGATPEAIGDTARGIAFQQAERTRLARNDLYQAINPDDSLNAVATPLKTATNALYDALPAAAEQPAGKEAGVIAAIRATPAVAPWSELGALDTRIGDAMKDAGVGTAAWGRLSQLKAAIRGTMDNAVENQVRWERQQVARGQLTPENTVQSRLQQWQDDFYARKAAEQSDSQNVANNAGSGQASVSGVRSTTGARNAGSGSATGTQGVSEPEPLVPNIDEAAIARQNAAKAAHAELVQTYRQGPVASILKDTGRRGEFAPGTAGAVPGKIFKPGPTGYETGQAFRTAVRNDPAAITAVRNHAAQSLRAAAENADGTLNFTRANHWIEQHDGALRAFPEFAGDFGNATRASQALQRFEPFTPDTAIHALPEMFFRPGAGGRAAAENLQRLAGPDRANAILSEVAAAKLPRKDGLVDVASYPGFLKRYGEALDAVPGLRQSFGTAEQASRTVENLAVARQQAAKEAQASVVGKLLKLTENGTAPESADVVNAVGSLFDSPTSVSKIGALVAKAAPNPQAAAAVKESVIEHIANKITSAATDTIGNNSVNKLVRDKIDTLNKVLSPEQVDVVKNIAANLQRRDPTRAKMAGSPGTGQLLLSEQQTAAHHSLSLPLWVQVKEGLEALKDTPHWLKPVALGGTVATKVANMLRTKGVVKVNDLVSRMILDPEFAGQMMRKYPATPSEGMLKPLARSIQRIGSAGYAARMQDTPQRAAGGRVDQPDHNPSEAQKAAGNYRKQHVSVQGLPITIENTKHSFRSGVGADGRPWRCRMRADYGYIKRTEGADGDHVDCYVGPNAKSDKVFIVDQRDHKTKKFDEHKCLIGFNNKGEALGVYKGCFSDGRGHERIGGVTEMTMADFKDWLKHEDATKAVAA